jgi:hypothetical protein
MVVLVYLLFVSVIVFQAFNYWLQIPENKLSIIIELTKLLHNASLLYVSYLFSILLGFIFLYSGAY